MGTGVQRLLPSARLPHRSHCLQVRRGRSQVHQVRRRCHRQAAPQQAHVRRALRRVPSPWMFAVRDMRQTVADGVIKATTPKEVAGKATKAAEKANKKKLDPVLGQPGAFKSFPENIPCVRLVLKINMKLKPFNFTLCSGCIMPLSWLFLFFHPKEEPRISFRE